MSPFWLLPEEVGAPEKVLRAWDSVVGPESLGFGRRSLL